MKRALLVSASILSLLAVVGCDQQSQKPEPARAEGNPPAAAQTIADTDLAVPADFEEESEKAITVANYKAELDTLDSELRAQ